jgi:hypothetical protein
MTPQQLAERVEKTHKLNRSAIQSAERRVERLDREAAKSTKVVERAVRRLRESA